VLDGGSSINLMVWSGGHKNDWDFFAAEAADTAWNYDAVLNIYRRIKDWHGPPDPKHRGDGGPVFVQPAPDPNPIAPAMVEGARSVGIPTFENQHGRIMEGDGGALFTTFAFATETPLRISLLYLPLHGSAESHGVHAGTGHTSVSGRKASHGS
jgi:GMC oxidoreductase